MNYKEVLRQFNNWKGHGYVNTLYMPSSLAINTVIEALEKQIPKKPRITIMEYAHSASKRTIINCPYCSEVKGLGLWESLIDKPTPYCYRCGQAIDWSEVEE